MLRKHTGSDFFTHQPLDQPQPQGYYEMKEHETILFEFVVTLYVFAQKR